MAGTVSAAAEEELEEESQEWVAAEELRGDGEPRAGMATFGTIGEFVEGNEDWTEYEERLGHFFNANGITEEAKKRFPRAWRWLLIMQRTFRKEMEVHRKEQCTK